MGHFPHSEPGGPMRHNTALDYRERLQRVLRHIQHHLDEDPGPADLAAVAHLSRYHFSRIFAAMVGESITEHTRRLRLERAAGALRRTEDTILTIALAAGYGSHEAFTRAFQAHFAMTPSAYRDAEEHPPIPCAACGVHYGPDAAVDKFVPLLQENPMLDIEIKDCPARRLAALRHVGPYTGMGQAFQQLMGWAFPNGLVGPQSEVVGVYHDDPRSNPAETLRGDACITAPPGFEGDPGANITIQELPAGRYAVGVYKGPYERLPEVYNWLFSTWLAESGHKPAEGPCYELYLNSPMDTQPEGLLTAIHLPVEG